MQGSTDRSDCLRQIFSGLADAVVEAPGRSFSSFAGERTTPGGIDEQMRAHLVERVVFEGPDAVLERITRASRQFCGVSPESRCIMKSFEGA